MSFLFLSIFLSAVIGFIITAWIRSFDIYEKETFTAMIMAFFAGGTTSVIVALVLYSFLGLFNIDDDMLSTTLGSFLVIGPVEELAKFTGLLIVYALIRRQFNELTDGIIYMSCVALGFSIIENYFYANAGENSQSLLIYRAFITTPAHISFSALVGYAWYRYRKENKPFALVILGLAIASLLHGVYDALAFSPYFNILLLVYLYLIMKMTLRVVQYTNILSPFRPGFTALFDNPTGEMVNDFECPCCTSSAPKAIYRSSYITSWYCESCGHHISTVRDIGRMFRIFAPEYKRFRKKITPGRPGNKYTLPSVYGVAFIDERRETGFFRVDDVAERIRIINETLLTRFTKRSIFSGNMLKRLIE